NSAPSNEIEPFPDYDRGLGIAFVETDGKPEMKGLNGLFSLMTVSLLALKQRGILTWTTGFEYKQGAFAVESNRLYQAKVDNASKRPSSSQNEWQVWASVSDIDVDNNGNIIKTAKAGGAFTFKVNDASTTVKGVVRAATATEVTNKSNVNAYVTPSNTSTIAQSTDLGVGQTWQDVTGSRQIGASYTNNTGKPVFASIDVRGSSSGVDGIRIIVGGVAVSELLNIAENHHSQITFIIPAGQSYSAQQTQATIDLRRWSELR
ncbi:MAG: hypothetical protein RSE18_00675, partial [Acinetobacter sp.]